MGNTKINTDILPHMSDGISQDRTDILQLLLLHEHDWVQRRLALLRRQISTNLRPSPIEKTKTSDLAPSSAEAMQSKNPTTLEKHGPRHRKARRRSGPWGPDRRPWTRRSNPSTPGGIPRWCTWILASSKRRRKKSPRASGGSSRQRLRPRGRRWGLGNGGVVAQGRWCWREKGWRGRDASPPQWDTVGSASSGLVDGWAMQRRTSSFIGPRFFQKAHCL